MALQTQLQGTVAKVTPVVTPRQDSGLGQALSLTNTLITVNNNLDTKKEKEQQAGVLQSFRVELDTIGQGVRQGSISKGDAELRSRKALREIQSTNQENAANLNQVFKNVTGLSLQGIGFRSIEVGQDIQESVQKQFATEVTGRGGDINNPNHVAQVRTTLQLENQVKAAEAQVSLNKMLSTVNKKDVDVAVSGAVNAGVISLRQSFSFLQEEVDKGLSIDQKVIRQKEIQSRFNDLNRELDNRKVEMSPEAFSGAKDLLKAEQQSYADVINEKITTETYAAQTKLVQAIGTDALNPTPQAVVTNKLIRDLGAMRDNGLFKALYDNPDLQKIIQTGGSDMFSRVLSANKGYGKNWISSKGMDDLAKATFTKSVVDTLITNNGDFLKESPQVKSLFINLINNTVTGWSENLDELSMPALDSLLTLASSPMYQKQIKGKPELSQFNSNFEGLVTNLSKKAFKVALDDLKGSGLSGDRLFITFDEQQDRFIAKPKSNNPSDSDFQDANRWNSKKGAIFNRTVQARAAVTGVDLKDLNKQINQELGVTDNTVSPFGITAQEEVQYKAQLESSGLTPEEVTDRIETIRTFGFSGNR